MVEFRINPNPPRTRRDESAWLDRDLAALRHLDDDRPEGKQPAQPIVTHDPSVEITLDAVEADTPAQMIPVAPVAAIAPAPLHIVDPSTQSPGAGPHPMLACFLKAMPEPGAAWSLEARLEWMRLAEGLFGVLYKTEGQIRFVGEAARADEVAT